MNHKKFQEEEALTWLIEDPVKRNEKIQREIIRYPKLIKDLFLDVLDTASMAILDVGGGPVSLITLLPAKERVVLDPLTDEYKKYFPCPYHLKGYGEEIPFKADTFELVVCTNALDHTQNPKEVVKEMKRVLRPGGYLAIMCAENNAINHKHQAHEHNLTAQLIHDWTDDEFETIWELTYQKDNYRYSWVSYNGKIGEPAFAMLLRKVTGY